MIRYKVDVNSFLEIKTKEMAYILGLIWADGHVKKTKENRHILAISLLKNDMDEVRHNFTKFGNWCEYKVRIKNEKPCTMLKLHIKQIVELLITNDYSSKYKSPCKILSKIPGDLKHYWWRGYFDGDGSLFTRSTVNCLNLSSCYYQNWKFVKKLFKTLKIEKFSIRKSSYINKLGKLHRSSCIIIQNINDIERFCSYIYNCYDIDRIGLTRKYKRYLTINDKFKRINNMIYNIDVDKSNINNRKDRISIMLQIIKKYPQRICNKTFQKAFSLSAPTISEDLKYLLDNKLIFSSGNTHSKIYF